MGQRLREGTDGEASEVDSSSSATSRTGVRGRWSPVASFTVRARPRSLPPPVFHAYFCKLRERAAGTKRQSKQNTLTGIHVTHTRRRSRVAVCSVAYLPAYRGDGAGVSEDSSHAATTEINPRRTSAIYVQCKKSTNFDFDKGSVWLENNPQHHSFDRTDGAKEGGGRD